jgi:hypothetical protein
MKSLKKHNKSYYGALKLFHHSLHGGLGIILLQGSAGLLGIWHILICYEQLFKDVLPVLMHSRMA